MERGESGRPESGRRGMLANRCRWTASIKTAARKVLDNLMTYYKGNLTGQTPGILPGPPPAGDYYWWEGGALWGTLVDYWHFTGVR
jgi:hypothetical protein